MSPTLDIIINRETEAWPADSESLVLAAAEAALVAQLHTGATVVELGITLADDATVRELNRDHRGQDKPTNVLSFPLTDGDLEPAVAGAPLLLGDVILAYQTVAREAAEQDKRLSDHVSHLVVHGVLHLLGHDHQADDQADAMESVEIEILRRLGIADPYADSPPVPPPERP